MRIQPKKKIAVRPEETRPAKRPRTTVPLVSTPESGIAGVPEAREPAKASGGSRLTPLAPSGAPLGQASPGRGNATLGDVIVEMDPDGEGMAFWFRGR